MADKTKANLLLLVTAIGWAMSTIIIKLYVNQIPVFHLMFGRYFIGFIFIIFLKRKELHKVKINELKAGSILGGLTFIAFTLAIMSLTYTSASKSGFLVAMSVLFVPIVTTILKKKLPNKWIVFSVGLSLIGLYYISGMNGGSFNKGDVLALLCAASYTIYILLLDNYVKIIKETELVIITMGVVSLISLVFIILFEGFKFNILIESIVAILIIALFGTLLTNLAQTKAQKHATPESVGLILLGEPLFTLIMASLILHEEILVKGLLGAGIILGALVLTVLKEI